MGFIFLGFFIFCMAAILAPVFDWTKNIYSNVNDRIGEIQAETFRSAPNKFYALATGLGSVFLGLFFALGTVFLCGWLVSTYMDDGLIKNILLFSFIIGTLIMPITFAIHVRVICDTWFKCRRQQHIVNEV